MRKTYNLITEPTGNVYKELLSFALKYCDSFQFTVVHHIQNNPDVKKTIRILEPYLINITEKSEWPGTILYNGTATVYLYKFNEKSKSILTDLVNGLYSWIQPNFPEDFCIRRNDNSPWLISITYEKDAYLELTSNEKKELIESIPSLLLEENIKSIN